MFAQVANVIQISSGRLGATDRRPRPSHWIIALNGSASLPSPGAPCSAGWGYRVGVLKDLRLIAGEALAEAFLWLRDDVGSDNHCV